MEVDAVSIEGHHEVLALHLFLFDCRLEDITSIYAGSPFIAAIQHRLADALESADGGTSWSDWRDAEQHAHRVDAVRRHLATAGRWWKELDPEQRDVYIRDVLAPLRLPAELLADLVAIEGEPLPTPNDGAGDGRDFD